MAETRRTRKTASPGWPKRGDIYLTALDPAVGHPGQKTRPALVIQNDTSNRHGAVTLIAPITSNVRLPISPLHVLLPAGPSTGLTVPSVAVFNQIRAVDRKRLIKKLGSVDALILAQAGDAIEAALGLAPELSLSPLDHESPATVTDAISTSTGDFRTGRYQR
jgi:mRNA interferase MazF